MQVVDILGNGRGDIGGEWVVLNSNTQFYSFSTINRRNAGYFPSMYTPHKVDKIQRLRSF